MLNELNFENNDDNINEADCCLSMGADYESDHSAFGALVEQDRQNEDDLDGQVGVSNEAKNAAIRQSEGLINTAD